MKEKQSSPTIIERIVKYPIFILITTIPKVVDLFNKITNSITMKSFEPLLEIDLIGTLSVFILTTFLYFLLKKINELLVYNNKVDTITEENKKLKAALYEILLNIREYTDYQSNSSRETIDVFHKHTNSRIDKVIKNLNTRFLSKSIEEDYSDTINRTYETLINNQNIAKNKYTNKFYELLNVINSNKT